MKPNANTRKPYGGPKRCLVIALDVGTTFSGVSYTILEPGEVPKIHGITRFPGQEHVAGNSKIPSVMYYDKNSKLRAAGAEAESSSVLSQAEDEGWIKTELFKLRLRPKTMKLQMNGMRLNPLPQGKTATDVFGDFLSYLYLCTRNFIIDTYASGPALWKGVERDIQFVLSHPNGWEGAQQTKMRRSAIYGGLIPDTDEGKARIRFVTEGEASLHACILNGLAADVLSSSSRPGFMVTDAGGGTLDVSSYAIRGTVPLVIEEIAPPDCIFAGSVFVSRRAREFLEEKLKSSKYGTPDALDHITKRFDETTKRLFRDSKEAQFIPFGSPLDKDVSVGIRGGQLKLAGYEVADFFEPSIEAAVVTIKAQIDAASGAVNSVWLVGGFAASPYLFKQLQERLAPLGVTVSRPDSQTSKAVADGAIGFYLDHHVSARMSKYMYGVEYLREFNSQDEEHIGRRHRLCELPSGPKLLPDAFDCILARNVKVKESAVFTRKYCTELTNLSTLSIFEVDIWCYRGGNTVPKWILRQAEEFSTLCVVRADLSPLSGSAKPKQSRNGRVYWTIVFSVEIHFGLTEFKARIKWLDDGKTKYGPASIVYNEGGVRSEEDEMDSSNEDDPTYIPSRSGKYASPRRPSPVASTSMTRENSKGTSYGRVAFVDAPSPRISEIERKASQNGSSIPYTLVAVSHGQNKREKESGRGKARELERGRPIEKGNEREKTPNHQSTDTFIAETLDSVWGSSKTPTYPTPPRMRTPSVSNSAPKTPVEKPKEKENRTPKEASKSAEQNVEPPSMWSSIPTVPTHLFPSENFPDMTSVQKVGKSKKADHTPSPSWGASLGLSSSIAPIVASSDPVKSSPPRREPSGRKKEERRTSSSLWGTFGLSSSSETASQKPADSKKTSKETTRSIEKITLTEQPPVDAPPRPLTPSPKMELPAMERTPSLSREVNGALNGNHVEAESKVNGNWNQINGDWNTTNPQEEKVKNGVSFSLGDFENDFTADADTTTSLVWGADPTLDPTSSDAKDALDVFSASKLNDFGEMNGDPVTIGHPYGEASPAGELEEAFSFSFTNGPRASDTRKQNKKKKKDLAGPATAPGDVKEHGTLPPSTVPVSNGQINGQINGDTRSSFEAVNLGDVLESSLSYPQDDPAEVHSPHMVPDTDIDLLNDLASKMDPPPGAEEVVEPVADEETVDKQADAVDTGLTQSKKKKKKKK